MSRAVGLLIACGLVGAAGALEIGPATPVTVMEAADATTAERTAAAELVDYLARVLGRPVTAGTEADPPPTGVRLYVGWTDAARRAGIDLAALGPEEWLLRESAGDLLVAGGRPRGTLYAAYHLLEDLIGVRWWTPWDETVPSRPELRLPPIDARGRPAFRYRDIYMLYGHDGGRFAARNRLNRDGDSEIRADYGGSMAYGPPYHVHTFFSYFPPGQYFADHPEWYSLIDGARTAERSQLCLTNPELRAAFLARLRAYIAESHAAAREAGLPPPLVFSVSQNDWYGACGCENCQAIARAEGSEAGPLLDFVNFLADGIREDYPEVHLDTLAYQYTQTAPRTVRCRDNVIVRLCDTEADMLKPITAPENRAFREHLDSWGEICGKLRVWDYAVTYAPPPGMPLPTRRTFADDLRYYAAHRVEGVFTEFEYPLTADLRDLKIWLLIKLLENPDADAEALTDTFLGGYLGAGGPAVGRYVRALEAEAERLGAASTCWVGSPNRMSYLNAAFVVRAHRLFDQAEAAAADQPEQLRRVRFMRLSLDRATLAVYAKLAAQWRDDHGDEQDLPLDRTAISARALTTWLGEIERRVPEAQRANERRQAEGELARYGLLPDRLPLPAAFANRPRGSVLDYPAIVARNWLDVAKVIADPEAESGVTNRLDLTAPNVEHPERYVLPMPSGVYGTIDRDTTPGTPIRAEDIPGPGYHWYRLGAVAVRPGHYLYFFWSWIIQVDIDNAHDPARPDQTYEIWASIKFEGPRFPHARAGQADAICVERVVLARTGE